MFDFCLTLAEKSHQDLTSKILTYAGKVPLIEVRLDYLAAQLLPELPSDTHTQFLATNRPSRQGGRYEGSEEARIDLLRKASDHGFQWIDLEYDVASQVALSQQASVVRSFHSFQGFPHSLEEIFRDLRRRGGDLFKVAVQISCSSQLKDLLLWMENLPEEIPRVIIGMGSLGQPSRILGSFLGNAWSYVSAAGEEPAAPGQFSLEEVTILYGMDRRNTIPSIYGVIGNPMDDFSSVRVHNRLFQHYALDAVSIPIQLDVLDPWFAYMDATRLPFRGLGVSTSFQISVRAFLHQAGESGKMGTLKREGPDWIGFRPYGSEMAPEGLAEQFRIWTGLDPDEGLIREVLDG